MDVRGAADAYVRDGHGIHKDRDRQYIPGCLLIITFCTAFADVLANHTGRNRNDNRCYVLHCAIRYSIPSRGRSQENSCFWHGKKI